MFNNIIMTSLLFVTQSTSSSALLAKELESPDWCTRLFALTKVERDTFRSRRVRKAVYRLLVTDSDETVQSTALRGLSRCEKNENKVPLLFRFVKPPGVRLDALKAIASINNQASG